MRIMHGLVREHGLPDDVADGEDVRHVGSDIDREEATITHRDAGLVRCQLLAIG